MARVTTSPEAATIATALPLPDPPLGRDGVTLRPWTRDDADALAAGWADPDVAAANPVPEDRSVAAARGWIAGEAERRERGIALDLAIADEADNVIGEVGLVRRSVEPLRLEVGFWLLPRARRRGLAATAVALLVGWVSRALGPVQVFATTALDDRAAGRVLTTAGLVRRGATSGRAVWVLTAGTVHD